jgi:hypothetical protein
MEDRLPGMILSASGDRVTMKRGKERIICINHLVASYGELTFVA